MMFPFIRQRDSMMCGVASLSMVCRSHGLQISLNRISGICHATNQGVSMLGISQAARELGFRTAAPRVTPGQLTECPLPAILHWNQTHFVVLYTVQLKKPA